MHKPQSPQENEATQVTRDSFIQRCRRCSAVFAAAAWLALGWAFAVSMHAQTNSKDYIYLGGRVIAIENPVQTATKLGYYTPPPTSGTMGTTLPAVVVYVEDANGNPVTGSSAEVMLTSTPSGFLSGTTTVNAVNGQATFNNLSFTAANTYTLTASSAGLASAMSAQIVIAATAPTATQLAFSTGSPTSGTAGATLSPVVVNVEGANGSLANTSSALVTLASSPPGLGGTIAVNAVSGVATFSNLNFLAANTYTLTASSGNLTPATSTQIVIGATAPTPTQLYFFTEPPSNGTSGATLSPLVVYVEGANGSLANTSSALVTLASSPPGLSGTTSVNAINGVATFSNLSFTAANTYTLTASSGNLTPATSTQIVVAATVPAATQLAFSTEPPSSGTAGTTLSSVVVQVQNATGSVANTSSAPVTLTASPIGLTGTTTVNAVSGVATFSGLSFTAAGNYTLTAASPGLTSAISTPDLISAPALPATHFQLTAPSTVTSGEWFPFTVTALDQNNNTATSYSGTVHFTSSESTASLPPDLPLTAGSGNFSATLTAGQVATYTIVATDTVNYSLTGSATITVNPAAAFVPTTVSPIDTWAAVGKPTYYTFSASSVDSWASSNDYLILEILPPSQSWQNWNQVCVVQYQPQTQLVFLASDSGTTFTHGVINSGSASLSNSQCMVGLNGTFTLAGEGLTVTLPITFSSSFLAGNSSYYMYPYVWPDVPNVGYSAYSPGYLQLQASAIAAVSGTTPQSAQISNPFTTPLSATVTDVANANNQMAGVSVTFTAPQTGASGVFSNGTNTITETTNASGVASAGSFTANSTAGGPYTVTATAWGISPASFSLTNTGAPATHFSVVAPASASQGVPLSFTVTALDASGNTVTGYTGNVHFTSSDGAATLPANATLTSGIGTFSATLVTAGNQTITATDSVTSSIAGTSGQINVAQVPHSMTAGSGTTSQLAQINTPFATPLSVTVKDVAGNPIAGLSVTFTAPPTSASGVFSNSTNTITVTTNASGLATAGSFTANTTAGGPYTVTAAATGLTTVTFSLTNTAGAAHSMATGSGTTPQSAAVSTPFTTPLSVTVDDASGNPVAGLSVTFTAPATGASGTFSNSTNTTTVATNGSGVASAGSFTANSTAGGFYAVTAAATGLTTVTFSLTNTAGAAHSMTAGTGTTPQSAQISAPFATPLSVTVDDPSGNPVSGISVTFAAPATGASGTFTGGTNTITATTNASGVASAGTLTANSTVGGPYTVTAAATGLTTVNFALTNTAGAAHSMTAGTGTTPQSAAIRTAFGTPLSVVVDDVAGNPVAGVSVTFTAPATGASGTFSNSTNTFTVTTNASGVASAGSFTANSTVGGPYTVTAAATGLSSVTFSLTNTAGVATHFLVVAPTSASQGVTLNFTVTALDANNNTVTGYAGTVHFTSSDGGATLPANATLTSGTGTFAATLITTGSQTITATDTLTSSITGTSGQISVAAPSIPTNLTITSGMTASTPCQASNTITISGSVTVSGNVTCTAGSQIILLPGFTAVGSSGTTFTAMINPNI